MDFARRLAEARGAPMAEAAGGLLAAGGGRGGGERRLATAKGTEYPPTDNGNQIEQ